MLRTNYAHLGLVIAARNNYTFEELMQIATNNMKHAKVKTVKTETHNGKIVTKTPFDLELIFYPDLGYSEVKNMGQTIFKKPLIGETGRAHSDNVKEFMRLATKKDLRKPLN